MDFMGLRGSNAHELSLPRHTQAGGKEPTGWTVSGPYLGPYWATDSAQGSRHLGSPCLSLQPPGLLTPGSRGRSEKGPTPSGRHRAPAQRFRSFPVFQHLPETQPHYMAPCWFA